MTAKKPRKSRPRRTPATKAAAASASDADADAASAAGLPDAADPHGRAERLAERALIQAHPELANEIQELSPEEAIMFLRLVEKALKKRRVMLAGYLLSLITMIGGMSMAFYVYLTREPGEFVGWVFLIPFSLVGALLYGFGRWARRF